jgi:predicted HTH domain antitoxin
MKKGRGRPPNQETIERRRIEEMFKNPPHYFNQADLDDQDAMLKNMDETKVIILSDYKSYPTVPHSHIFEMASIGDESLHGYESLIIKNNERLMDDIHIDRQTGSIATKENAHKIAIKLYEENKILLERMQPFGKLSKNQVATIIKSQWNHIPPEQRKEGEEDLDRRGVEGFGLDSKKIPSIRTIERHISLGSPFTQQKVRQSSRDKK